MIIKVHGKDGKTYEMKEIFPKEKNCYRVFVCEELKKFFCKDYHDDTVYENGQGIMAINFQTFGTIDVEQFFHTLDDVPFDMLPDGSQTLAEPWEHFEVGTDKEDIWRWFLDEFGHNVGEFM